MVIMSSAITDQAERAQARSSCLARPAASQNDACRPSEAMLVATNGRPGVVCGVRRVLR